MTGNGGGGNGKNRPPPFSPHSTAKTKKSHNFRKPHFHFTATFYKFTKIMTKKFFIIGIILIAAMLVPRQCAEDLAVRFGAADVDYDAVLGDGNADLPEGEKPCTSPDGRTNPLGGVLEVRTTGAGRPVETGLFRVGKDAVRVDEEGNRRNHKGVDLYAEEGTPVYAVADGVVESGYTGYLRDYGNTVTLDTNLQGKDVAVLYAHLSKMTVKPGQKVSRGQLIGYTGRTGNAGSGDPHLHYEIREGKTAGSGKAVDPLPYLNGSPDMTTGAFLGMKCR